jgi:hypothetical protein
VEKSDAWKAIIHNSPFLDNLETERNLIVCRYELLRREAELKAILAELQDEKKRGVEDSCKRFMDQMTYLGYHYLIIHKLEQHYKN